MNYSDNMQRNHLETPFDLELNVPVVFAPVQIQI